MKKLFLIVSIICFVSCFPANADTRDVAPLEKVSIQLKWFHQFQFAGYYAAAEKGFYAEEGLEVTLKERNPQKSPVRSVLDGDAAYGVADAGLLAEHPIIMSAADYDFPPFSIANEAGEADGFSVELLKASANAVDIDVEFYSAPWAIIKEELATGKLDVLPVVGRTPEREADFDFTVPYITIYGNVYVREGDHRIREIEDLEDMQVVVKKKDNAEEFVKRVQISKNIIALDSFEEAFTLLSKGSYDAIITNEVVGTRVIDKLGIDNIVSILQIDEYKQDFTFAVTEGNKELLALLNEGLSRVIADGTYDRLRAKWFKRLQQIKLTTEERAWIKAHPKIVLGIDETWKPWIIKNPDGSFSGVDADIVELLNQRLGTDISFEVGQWADMVKKLENKEIDGLSSSAVHDERRSFALFTDHYTTRFKMAFVQSDNPMNITSPEDLAGKRIAFYGGNLFIEKYLSVYPDVTLVEKNSASEMFDAVFSGEADALIGSKIISYTMAEQEVDFLTPVFTVGRPLKLVFSIRKDWPELVSALNKGIKSISEAEQLEIRNRYPTKEPPIKEVVTLSDEEQAWLAENQTVRVRVLNFPPYIIPKEDGDPEGISIDYLKLIAEHTGVKFKYHASGKAFPEALEGLKKHQGPDLISTMMRTPERQRAILFSKEYLKSPYGIFTLADDKRIIAGIDDIIDKKVALARGTVLYEMVKKDYPDLNLVLFDNDIQAIKAVAAEQADAYIGNLTLASYFIFGKGLYNLKLAAPSPFGDHVFSMGIRNDWPELAGIIDKGLATISPDEQQRIRSKYISLRFEQMDTAVIIKWVLIVAVVASGIIFLFVFWNHRLKSLVEKRTAKLEIELYERQQVEKKYRDFVHNSLEAVWAYDLEPPLPMDLTAEEQLNLLYERAHISEANDALAHMLGYEKGEELLGLRLDDFQPRTNPENVAYVKNVVREKYNVTDYETTAFGSAGKKRILNSNILGIRKNGKLVRIWGTSRDVTEKKQLENELIMNKKDLQKLAGWLISRQEKERSRLARELHDDLTQKLAVIAIEAGNIEEQFKDIPEPVRQKVSYIREQLIKVSEDVHNLSRDLHPSIICDLGLERAVRSECSNFSKRTGIALVFEPGNVPSNVPAEISLTLYRIIQECLLNISKYAKTKTACVILERSNGSVVLTVQDAGTGFNPEEVRGRTALGFRSMRERLRLVNGKLSITSDPGKGTTVRVEIPLKG